MRGEEFWPAEQEVDTLKKKTPSKFLSHKVQDAARVGRFKQMEKVITLCDKHDLQDNANYTRIN